MIKNIYNDFKNDIRTKITFIASIVFGLITYSYLLNNNVYNHDSIYMTPTGYGCGIGVGRWSLQLLGGICDKLGLDYNIPIFKIGMAIIFISVAAVFIVKLLNIKNKYLCIILPGIIMVFPSTVGAFMFSFTAHYYMFGFMCLVIGTYLATIEKKLSWLLSIGFIGFGFGFYQAYIQFVIVLFVLSLLSKCMEDNKWIDVLKTGIRYVVILILGYLVYDMCLKICLNITGITLIAYQGVSEMGSINMSTIWEQVCSSYKFFFALPFEKNIGISSTIIIRIVYLLMYIVVSGAIFIYLIYDVVKRRNYVRSILTLFLMLVFPLASYFIFVMVLSKSYIHTLMLMGGVGVFVLAILVADFGLGIGLKNISKNKENSMIFKCIKLSALVLGVLVSIGVADYFYQANGNFTRLYYSNEKVENYYSVMLSRIQSVDEYTVDKEIVFVGGFINDTNLNYDWGDEIFDNTATISAVNIYSRNDVFRNLFGYKINNVAIGSNEYLEIEDDILRMGCYPDANSIKVIGDDVVVRLN